MAIAHSSPKDVGGAERSRLTRLLEGDRLWGHLDDGPGGRAGWQRLRLVVYPPGSTARDRRLLALNRHWLPIGALLGLLISIILEPDLTAWPAMAVGLAVTVLGQLITAHATGKLRKQSATIAVAQIPTLAGVEVIGDANLLKRTLAELDTADTLLVSGSIDLVEFERRWAHVHQAVKEREAPTD